VLLWHLGAVLFVGAAGAGTYHGLQTLHAQRAAQARQEAAAIAETVVAEATRAAPVVADATPSAPAVADATRAAPAAVAPVRKIAAALPVPPLPKAPPVASKASHRVTRVAMSTRRRVYVAAPMEREPPPSSYPGYLAYAPGAGYYPYYAPYRYYYGAY
jgi:hypothetical protein